MKKEKSEVVVSLCEGYHGQGFTTFHDRGDDDGIRICFIYFLVMLVSVFSVLGHFSVLCLQLCDLSARVLYCRYVTIPSLPYVLL